VGDVSGEVRRVAVEKMAYELWEGAQRVGLAEDAVGDWLAAESLVDGLLDGLRVGAKELELN